MAPEAATPVWMTSDLILRLAELLAAHGDMPIYVRMKANKRPHYPIAGVEQKEIMRPLPSIVTSLSEILQGKAPPRLPVGDDEIVPVIILTI